MSTPRPLPYALSAAATLAAARPQSVSLMERPLDMLMAIFFAIHIFPSLVFAPQVALPPHLAAAYVPAKARLALEGAVAGTGDPFLSMALGSAEGGAAREPWMAGIFTAEVVLQLPFFVYAITALCMNWKSFRIPAIIYATHSLTTQIPIMAELLYGRSALFAPGGPFAGQDEQAIRTTWVAMYAPFAVFPLILLVQQVFFNVVDPRRTVLTVGQNGIITASKLQQGIRPSMVGMATSSAADLDAKTK
ncbi:hypothetical protein BC831DRAFT_463498 [Entophlyctis helioformis]|nr:hypothetical protein BC831DRAFT_463498 [Entophlyctis helioformis]